MKLQNDGRLRAINPDSGYFGVIRRDPMAMNPFCGYNYADCWAHWLSFAERSDRLPSVFHVNWFRQNDEGEFLWPGIGENLRVLRWIVDSCGSLSPPRSERQGTSDRISEQQDSGAIDLYIVDFTGKSQYWLPKSQ